MENEIWKPIPGYEGLYEVSNLGRVRSIKYFNPANNKIYIRTRVLKPSKHENGYLRVGLCKNCKEKKFRIHRLVGMVFISNPNNYLEINHIDGNKENNCVSNLEWCTREYNIKEACRLGLVTPPKRYPTKHF